MKKKGGLLNDFKLYYERLPSEPTYRPSSHKKRPEGAKKRAVGANLHVGLANTLAYFMVISGRRAFRNRSALSSANIKSDDRKTMSKVPQTNKKRTTNSKR